MSQTGIRAQFPVMTPDRELLTGWVSQGDETAFRSLVERHAGLVHGVAMRRTEGRQALAREIGQNVFTMLARKAGSLTRHTSIASWLYRATLLEAAHQLRQEASRARRAAAFAHHHTINAMPADPDPDETALRTPPGFEAAMAALSEGDRTLLLRRFFEERSYREIAEVSGLSEAAIRKRSERALRRLAAFLSRRGAAVTPLAAAASARAAFHPPLPAGHAAALSGAALGAAPALTPVQLSLHTLQLMTCGKSISLSAALALLLLTFGGGYSTAHFAGGNSAPPNARGPLANTAGGPHAGNRAALPAGIPGDSPERAKLRSTLRRISKGIRVNLGSRSVSFVFDNPSMAGGVEGLQAMAEIRDEDLDEAWKLLPDFRGNAADYEGLAAFLASMRRAKAPPRQVLEELLKSDLRVNGKPPQFAVFETTGAWFAKEPAAAWDWMVKAVATGDYPFDRRRPWGQEQMSQWLGRDPAAALAALAPLPSEWNNFTRKALAGGLEKEEQRKVLWPAIQQADDRTALMVAGSQPKPSDWSRETLLPWLMTREWTNGVTPERIAHEWTWHNGTLDNERFRMLCEAVGTLPTEAANQAVRAAIREAVGSSESADRTRFLEHLLPDPTSRERLLKVL